MTRTINAATFQHRAVQSSVGEFFSPLIHRTLLLPNTNVGGYVNTGRDLVSNLVGAVSTACWIRWPIRILRPLLRRCVW